MLYASVAVPELAYFSGRGPGAGAEYSERIIVNFTTFTPHCLNIDSLIKGIFLRGDVQRVPSRGVAPDRTAVRKMSNYLSLGS